MAENKKKQFAEDQGTNPDLGEYDTPINESDRKTGVADKTNAKASATPETGSSDTLVEGSPNQGTEKR